ncbi:AN1-type zinc finger protein 4-like [Asterias rubens]|uniref:AN1-type zinc finger protein 4-like n=1 Tax=Asterias rubens TaxID=7604 RepID=UPI0014554FC8|nr:AN1-type zinc finger protein 4-like [Asterias rubens]
MEYFEYPEYADIMELFIETLTGTVFELRVSPFETVISVKAKIQRLEGIPISQQHLIWRSVELEDDYCLHDYGIPPSSSLKLVLAMRGGPINTRRIPMEDPAIREMAEYMEANRDEIWEKLPGNRQVTLLVFREGDQLNFFRVVDRGDGTLTPLSESLSGASMYNNMYEEEEDEGRLPSEEQSVENDVTMSKMKLLRVKMETLSIGKKKHKTPHPPSTVRPKSTAVRRRLPTTKKKSPPLLNKNNPLPPVGALKPGTRPVEVKTNLDSTTEAVDCAAGSASRAERRLRTSDKCHSPVPPSSCRTLESLTSARLHRSYTNLGNMLPSSTATVMHEMRPNTSSKVQQVLTSSADARGRERSGVKAEARLVTELVNQANRDGKINDIVCGAPRDLHTGKSSGRVRAGTSGAMALSQALNSTTSTALKNTSNGDRIQTPERRTNLISAHSIRGRLSGTRDGRLLSPSHRLPPVSSSKPTSLGTTKKKTSKRCSLCNKKTGLATSYQCRCGHNFCATHRYAEAHHCGYDYKTEGRKILEQSNPLVSAPKLPKI